MTLQGQIKEEEKKNIECLFWDEKGEKWSNEGCKSTLLENTIECLCSHLTNFTAGNMLSNGGIAIGQEANLQQAEAKGINTWIFVGAGVGGGILLAIAAAFIILKPQKKNMRKKDDEEVIEIVVGEELSQKIHLMEKIGQGAFSTVFRAIQGETTAVAVKKQNQNSEKKSFLYEAHILKSLAHPHIVQYFGIFEDPEGRANIVTEYMDGGDLLSLLRNSSLKSDVKHGIVLDLAGAMSYLVQNGIVHADVSARNVLMRQGNIPKLSDFGLARKAGEKQVKSTKPPIRWSAPEVLRGEAHSHQSDVFSFAVLIWEIIYDGKTPFGEKNNEQVVDFVTKGGRLCTPSGKWGDIMKKCWSEEAKERMTFKDLTEEITKQVGLSPNIRTSSKGIGSAALKALVKKDSSAPPSPVLYVHSEH
eukprot:TRINITY_DN5201_c1_g1_i2.p1 TRINITY_DN5201_c1_g1~~TRINITY_DN5201_c1_g1_i2.p1  ORF type:complete len:417 (+),score=139.51 TRINITY_DN5201_c1_g1_i2:379-1629(+)